jgi:hypothetical protein
MRYKSYLKFFAQIIMGFIYYFSGVSIIVLDLITLPNILELCSKSEYSFIFPAIYLSLGCIWGLFLMVKATETIFRMW